MTALERLIAADAVGRLSDRDPSLWSDDREIQDAIANRLGWTDLATTSGATAAEAAALARDLQTSGVTDLVLLGMGGSSLAALTMSRVLAHVIEGPRLHVLDTTSPTTVAAVMHDLDPRSTVFFVSSKSGGTIEPNTLYAIFRRWMEAAVGDDAGSHFVAVTDPGSSLAGLAEDEGFRATFLAPPDVGGRYSALTPFGLVPAAAIGADTAELLARAAVMQERCSGDVAGNPAASLAAFMGDGQAAGRDKLTIVTSPDLFTFSLWAEQLIAESTGKQGTGVVPVPELAAEAPAGYGDDRAVVVMRYPDDAALSSWALAERGNRPVFEIVLDDPYDLGAEFVRWEYATALVGFLLGINPFDEPNVAEAKAATNDVLDGTSAMPDADAAIGETAVRFGGGIEHRAACGSLPDALEAAIKAALGDRSYLAVLAYLPDDDRVIAPLRRVVPVVAASTRRATVLELGPRYLHSTGQLYKGGPAEGVFVILTTRGLPEVSVPGRDWTLGDLFRAQAVGDFLTLDRHGRPVVWLDLPDASGASIDTVAEALIDDALLG